MLDLSEVQTLSDASRCACMPLHDSGKSNRVPPKNVEQESAFVDPSS